MMSANRMPYEIGTCAEITVKTIEEVTKPHFAQ